MTGKITKIQIFSTFVAIVLTLMEFYVVLYGTDQDVLLAISVGIY
jgi:hypothetical protein